MGMFCFQCQETARGTGCEVRGVCGKSEEIAKLQDLLIYTLRGISDVVVKGDIDAKQISKTNHEVISSLFMTITNANFDDKSIELQIKKMLSIRDNLSVNYKVSNLSDASTFNVNSRAEMLEKAALIGVLSESNEDIRSLREMITYGLKGLAAYTHHALNVGYENEELYKFIYEALSGTLNIKNADELVALTLKTGQYGVQAMALLDKANTSRYGNPEITNVSIGVRANPAILISGHDLTDLEQLLEQTKNSGVDVYTHSEMLPANYYPHFKKYDNLVGNYGNAWWKQLTEFESFNGPILFC